MMEGRPIPRAMRLATGSEHGPRRGLPLMPMSGRTHPGYAGDPQMPAYVCASRDFSQLAVLSLHSGRGED